jgi:hypothetical protein
VALAGEGAAERKLKLRRILAGMAVPSPNCDDHHSALPRISAFLSLHRRLRAMQYVPNLGPPLSGPLFSWADRR